MEPDLDRLLDFESGGALFPQFATQWRAVFDAALAVKSAIGEAGIPRPRVAILASDPLSFCALFVALCRCDLDLFLFNPKWGRQEMEQALALAQPDWKAGNCGASGFALERIRSASARTSNPARKLRVMIATGGTSGKIRFATHDWSTLAASAYGFAQYFGCDTVSSHCLLPLHHVSGFMQLVRSLLTMGSIVFGDLDTFARSHERIMAVKPADKMLSLVATQLERLLRAEANAPLLRDYRAVFLGGGPAPAALLEDCRDLRIPVALTYGMTETAAQVSTLLPDRFLRGETSQGKALPHARIDIVAETDLRQVLARGERGRIRIYSASLCKGYFGEAASADTRMLVTADIGYIAEDGCLTVVGRADRVVISGGEKIDLREVELCVERTNLVRDVVAFGVRDAEWGEKLVLAYAPKESFVSEAALREAVKPQLATFKFPKVWIRADEIPRNEAGKPILARLAELATAASRA